MLYIKAILFIIGFCFFLYQLFLLLNDYKEFDEQINDMEERLNVLKGGSK